MILQLAQHVQNFLHQNNVPPPSSFYEEMMAKKQRDIEQQKAAELEKKEMERKANDMQIKEEVEIKLRSFNHWTIGLGLLFHCRVFCTHGKVYILLTFTNEITNGTKG